jgi:hypothetical protein
MAGWSIEGLSTRPCHRVKLPFKRLQTKPRFSWWTLNDGDRRCTHGDGSEEKGRRQGPLWSSTARAFDFMAGDGWRWLPRTAMMDDISRAKA